MSRWARHDQTRDKPLPGPESRGLTVGSIVTFTSEKHNTGGVIYQIVEDQAPIKPHTTVREVTRMERQWVPVGYASIEAVSKGVHPGTREGEYKEVPTTVKDYGAWDEKGKKIMSSALSGFVRIAPVYTFFPTRKGKEPVGKGNTIIIGYDDLRRLQKLEITNLGSKYIELGELLKTLARRGGAEDL